MIRALYQPRTGFRDYLASIQEVTILGFVVAEIEPRYQRSGSKRCTVAVIALDDGRLVQAELTELTYQCDLPFPSTPNSEETR